MSVRFHAASGRIRSRCCRLCGHRFKPRWVEQRTCSRTCRIAYTADRQRGNQPRGFVAHVDRRRLERKQEIEAICQARWPELSVREIQIFNFAIQVGYRRGYTKGYHRGGRREIEKVNAA